MLIKDMDIFIADGNYSGKYPKNNEFVKRGIPFIRANNISSCTITDDDMYYITEEKHNELLKGHLKTGDILITTRGNIGKVAIVPQKHDNSNINAQIVLLRVNNKKIYNRFLLWALQSSNVKKQYDGLQTGTALKQLPVGRLKTVDVNVPDMITQRKIASILDVIAEIIQIRNIQLKQLELLNKSRFVEMFGDPINNNKGYKRVTLNKISNIGSSKRIFEKEYVDEGVPFYRTKEVVELSKGNKISTELFISKNRFQEIKETYGVPEKNDLLITAVGTIGVIWIVDGKNDFYFKDGNLLRVSASKQFNSVYMKHLLEILFSNFKLQMSTGTAYAALTITDLKKMSVYDVPIKSQKQFADFVMQTDKLKFMKLKGVCS